MLIFKFGIGNVNYNYKGNVIKLRESNFDLVLTVIARRLMNKKVKLKNGFVEIPTQYFKSVYDNNAVYLDYLVKNKVITRCPYSSENHICFAYKFNNSYIKNLNLQGVIFYNNDRVKKNRTQISNSDIEIDKQLLIRLKRDFNSVKFELNNIVKLYFEGSNFVDAGKWFNNVYNLYKWNKGKEYKSFNITSNRIYTNFTCVSSSVRKKNVLLSNEELQEFDISSSFPKMLALYCKNVNPELVKDPDFVMYCTFVKNNTFYEVLKDKLNTTINCDNNKRLINRRGQYKSNRLLNTKTVKYLFQIFLNGNINRTPYVPGYSNSFIREQFALLFPSVYNEIIKVKNNKEKMYFKLVNLETQFILKVIADLYDKFPKIKVLTVHDAIYVPKSFEQQVKEVWDFNIDNLLSELPDDILGNIITPNVLEDYGMYYDDDDVDDVEEKDDFDFLNEFEDEDNDSFDFLNDFEDDDNEDF